MAELPSRAQLQRGLDEIKASVERFVTTDAERAETKAKLLERLAWGLRNEMPVDQVADALDEMAVDEREVAAHAFARVFERLTDQAHRHE